MEPTSATGLVSELARHYPSVPRDEVARDVAALLVDLEAHAMIESRP